MSGQQLAIKEYQSKKESKRYRALKSFCRLFFLDRKRADLCGLILMLCAALAVVAIMFVMQRYRGLPSIPAHVNETEDFRTMRLTEEVIRGVNDITSQTDDSRWKVLAVLMAGSGFNLSSGTRGKAAAKLPDSLEEYDAWKERYEEGQGERLSLLEQSYHTLLSDLVYFPVMMSSQRAESGVSYADSWYAERAYQDKKHVHEGTDIMALNNERGYYPIVSMTDGVVENIGWLEKGGYRIGIRSPHGAYLYYAHLYRYADELEKGDTVKAGQLLGFMGDSGYSKVEGTVGNFDVHLHLGIYLKTEHFEEVSVNPYWILRQLEGKTVVGDY